MRKNSRPCVAEKQDGQKLDKEEALVGMSVLKVKQLPCPNEMHLRMLKQVRMEIAEALGHCLPIILQCENVPKGCKDKSSNCGVSNSSLAVGKVLEKIIWDKICIHSEAWIN